MTAAPRPKWTRSSKLRALRNLVYGLATDYCVMATAIDAAADGYKVVVIEGLSKGVAPDTTAKALEAMKAKGITILKEIDMKRINDL